MSHGRASGGEECGRCGRQGLHVGEGRVEPSEGRWLCQRCCDGLAALAVQRASTDTGRKRGAHTIILRELGWLTSQSHEARRADKRQRADRPAAAAAAAAAAADPPGPASEPAAAAARLEPGEALLAAIRDCPTHRYIGNPDVVAAAAAAAAVALADAHRAAGSALPPETLRAALGASCRVGQLPLVRAVLHLMESDTPPYAHSGESFGILLKFLIDRREFWRACAPVAEFIILNTKSLVLNTKFLDFNTKFITSAHLRQR